MALITKIRQRAGLAVGMVAFGLILFLVGGDLLGPNSIIRGNKNLYVGEIDGTKIKRDEFLQEVDEMKNNYAMNYGKNPTDNDMYTVRQQAWDYLIVKYAFQKQFDKLGVAVTNAEVVDMVQGNNISPEIRQAFTNPKTGIFDRDQVVNYLQHINDMPAQQQAVWYMFEKNLRPSRLQTKYDNLLLTTNYVTDQEAKEYYEAQNSVAEVKYLYIPYFTVKDSFQVTDDMLSNYLESHKNQYQVDESRDISYVSFPIYPSHEDSVEVKKDIDNIAKDLPTVTDDSIYAVANSDGTNAFGTFNPSQLPANLRSDFESLHKGEIIGPMMYNGSYVIYKIANIKKDSIEYARASHILIKPQDQSEAAKEKAKQKAQDILNKVLHGADFPMTARQESDDGSSTAGGDLGWFSRDRMVKPFADAVFSAKHTGIIPHLIETQYGFHIINVTHLPTDKLVSVATIEKTITPGDAATNLVFRRADRFQSSVSNYNDFINQAKKDSLRVVNVDKLGQNDRNVTGLGSARDIVSWAYNKASVGQVSELFEENQNYVVAVLTRVHEKGTAKLEDVKDEITQKVINDHKADIITKKLASRKGSIDDIAKAYGNDAKVYSSSNLHLSSNTLPNVGYVPKSIGVAFGLKDGQVSSPVKEDDGIVVIQMDALTKAPPIGDYTTYKNQLDQARSNNTAYLLSETVKKFADIKDYRYKFF